MKGIEAEWQIRNDSLKDFQDLLIDHLVAEIVLEGR